MEYVGFCKINFLPRDVCIMLRHIIWGRQELLIQVHCRLKDGVQLCSFFWEGVFISFILPKKFPHNIYVCRITFGVVFWLRLNGSHNLSLYYDVRSWNNVELFILRWSNDCLKDCNFELPLICIFVSPNTLIRYEILYDIFQMLHPLS